MCGQAVLRRSDEPGPSSNTGFILLSMVVERLSGKTFPEFMQERVFGPLGMTHRGTVA